MTHRTNMKDVEIQARALEDSLKALGMIGKDDEISVREGSKTYGQAFRIQYRTARGGWMSKAPCGLPDYLGMTKAEAFHTLHTMNRVLWAIISREVVA